MYSFFLCNALVFFVLNLRYHLHYLNLSFFNFPDNCIYYEFESACRAYRKLDEESKSLSKNKQENKDQLESIMKQIVVKKEIIECFLQHHQSQQVIFGILGKNILIKNNETFITQTIGVRQLLHLPAPVEEDWNLIITMNTRQRTPTFTYRFSGELYE